MWAVNPNLPLAQVRTLQEIYDKSLARTSFTLVMLAIAGAMALLIGLVGIYGVISYSVAQRRREIGIRLALGAPADGLLRMFVGHALALGAIGVGLRRDRGAGSDAADLLPAIPCERGRPGHLLAGFRGPPHRGIAGQLPPGPPRHARRSGRSAARGIAGSKPIL